MPNDKIETLPEVSIVVPAYNAEKNITRLLESLLGLDYPEGLLEIIIVDNKSIDRTRDIVKRYPVILLEEKKIQSPYAARNKGILAARGEIIAFTDSDCIVDSQWLKEGVGVLISESADLVAGRIEFTYSKNRTVSEILDSISGMRNEYYVEKMNAAVTANLFAKAQLFRKIGLFEGSAISGEDIRWTQKATRGGSRIIYSPKVVIQHPARQLSGLLKKRLRDGTGIIYVRINMGMPLRKIAYSVFKLLMPVNLSRTRELFKKNKLVGLNKRIMTVLCIEYLCKIAMFIGVLSYLPNIPKQQIKNPVPDL